MDTLTTNGITDLLLDDLEDAIRFRECNRSKLKVEYPEGYFVLYRKDIRDLAYRLLHWCNTGSLKLPTDKEP